MPRDEAAYDPRVTGTERLNALTHGTGALLALAGAIVLVVLASLSGDPWRIAAAPSLPGALPRNAACRGVVIDNAKLRL